ncbi:hypothetical protein B0T12DRAFT_394796 [Alternaria alternata]|nr:hypothetical protein B0T12DRAFT_394796 [Alternaria alternata]
MSPNTSSTLFENFGLDDETDSNQSHLLVINITGECVDHGGLDLSFICSSLLEWQTALAKLPGQRYLPMIHDKFQELSVSVPNTPPPRPAPKPYPTGPHQSGVSKAGFPGTRQLDGGNWTRNLPSGYSETQGKRKMGIIRGKHECWACLPVRRMKRGFGSTNGLGNYERGFHDELMEVETKFEGGQQLSKEV